MIQSAKEAKAIGLAWCKLEFRLPDGSRQEIVGPYSKARALEIFTLAAKVDVPCTLAINDAERAK